MSTDAPRPWEPGSFASPQRHHAFAHYRDLPLSERSIRRAHADHQTQCLGKTGYKGAVPGLWNRWSQQDAWLDRVMAWDNHVDTLRREKVLAEQRSVIEKHQRALAAALTVNLLPTKLLLTRMGKPGFDQELAVFSTSLLLREVLRANTTVPALILAERAAHGLTTAEIEVVDRRAELERDRAIADRIAADPRLTDLAVQMLDGIAREGSEQITPTGTAGGNLPVTSTAPAPIQAGAADDEDDDG